MSGNRRETKSRNRSGPKRIERAGSEHRRDPRWRNSRRKFGNLNINFIEILDERSKTIREDLKVIRIRRVKAKDTIFGSNGRGEGARNGKNERSVIIIMSRSENVEGIDKIWRRSKHKINNTGTRGVTQIVDTMKSRDTKSVNRVKDMELMSIDNLSKRDTVRISLKVTIIKIMSKRSKTGIEIPRKENRALRGERSEGGDKFSKTARIVR